MWGRPCFETAHGCFLFSSCRFLKHVKTRSGPTHAHTCPTDNSVSLYCLRCHSLSKRTTGNRQPYPTRAWRDGLVAQYRLSVPSPCPKTRPPLSLLFFRSLFRRGGSFFSDSIKRRAFTRRKMANSNTVAHFSTIREKHRMPAAL